MPITCVQCLDPIYEDETWQDLIVEEPRDPVTNETGEEVGQPPRRRREIVHTRCVGALINAT